jgi:acetylornithine deacetylase/succinyl-diaminopimelate desuccinylase-like protein
MIETQEVIDLVSQLVRIDSANPWLIEGAAGERKVADYISRWLVALGLDVWLDEVEPGRPNLVAVLRGKGGGKSLCLNAHLDTVGYALWRDAALTPRLDGDRLYGLGSADDKGHCAAGMLVMKSLITAHQELRGDVWLALTIDEEGTSSGTMAFVKQYHPNAVLVMEPFGMGNITITHQGFGWLDIIVEGKAAHGCAPEKGVDAIAHMAEVITRLHKIDQEKYAANPHPLNGKTVFHTGTIQGGTDYATYPDRCQLGIEIGTQPGETIQNRIDEIETVFSEIKAIDAKFKGEVQVNLARNPFLAQGHEALLEILSAEVGAELGQPPLLVGENAWGDAALFQEAGIPTLMTGAYGENFHAPQEWVSVSELVKLVNVVERTVVKFCA